ncbi:MAG: 50S ribosomal protein L29 [Erysipelotrichaceae bacterium]|nr:50S ribosomal protein L29 [Erysipelotrichaceae bacterium]
MNIKEIRDLSDADLLKTLDESRKELFDLKFEKATGTVENPMRIRELRKTIARILTILKEKENEKKEG